MKINNIKLVYFSPTRTTKAIVEAIAEGIKPDYRELIDITSPEGREKSLVISKNDLLLVGVPVYMGRVPALATEWLLKMQANNTPTVCVVVYGNRAYDNALLELKDIVTDCGCIVVAGAAYIGEHSFSNDEEPVAVGRPDKNDLQHANEFGRKINEKLQSFASASELIALRVPGGHPYGGVTKIWDVDFIAVGESCVHCGICAEVCPTAAVDRQDSSAIDVEKCITCCACIKNCPQKARTIKPGSVKDAAKRLHGLFREPKKPECFL